MRKYGLLFTCIFVCQLLHAQTYQPSWESLDKRPVPQWFRDARFGIFIHWGVYSVPGWSSKGQYAEWYQQGLNSGDTARISYHKKKFGDLSYYQLADQFKAELYNPDEWARIIEQSGARYVVLTSKHHDGWANWPSAQTAQAWDMPWNAGAAGPYRDLLGDLFTAIRKTSVHPGMYYSLYEWFNPIWKKDKQAYVSGYMWPQMKDLVNTYRPEVFWTDGDWDGPDTLWKSTQFLAWLYNESPVKDKVVTYDRWGAGIRFHHGGVYTPEYQPNADFEDHPWEESRGMGFSYGYNREEDSWDYNSANSLVLQLIDKVSRGGNFLLDIGPDEHGKIPPIMEERLLQIGSWMKANGEAIYGATRWKEPSQWSAGRQDYTPPNGGGDLLLKLTVDPDSGYAVKECFFTYNAEKNDLYALLPKWPGATFKIAGLAPAAGTRIELLETHDKLTWHMQGNDCVIDLPAYDPSRLKATSAYVIKLFNTGAFARRPEISVSYPRKTMGAMVTIKGEPGDTIRYDLFGSSAGFGRLYTGPFSVPNNGATLSVRAFREKMQPSATVTKHFTISRWKEPSDHGKLKPGLHYYAREIPAHRKFVCRMLNPQWESQYKTADSGTATTISSKYLSRKENAALTFDGYIYVPSDDVYTFYLSSDDGSVMGMLEHDIIDNDGNHGPEERSEQVPLKKGYHSFAIVYFNGTGDGQLSLQYSTDKISKRPVPENLLFQPAK
jgi:alpha-L-fucosidase